MQLAWEQREAALERQLDQQEDESLSRAELVDSSLTAQQPLWFCKMASGPVMVQSFVFRIPMAQSLCGIPASLLLIS